MEQELHDYEALLNPSLTSMLDTFEMCQIVSTLRPHFLAERILLLTVGEISLLSALQDGTYEGVPRDKMTREAHRLLRLWSSGSLDNIKTINGILFSTVEMATRNTLKFFTPRNFLDPGHFIFFTFCLTTRKVKLIDSLSDSLSNSLYFCESTLRTLFSFVLRAKNYSSETELSKTRGFLPQVTSKRTVKKQTHLECGSVSAFNLIMSLRYNYDFLKAYTFDNYQESVSNIKPLLCHILYNHIVPFEAIKEID